MKSIFDCINSTGKEIVTQIVPIPEQIQKIPGRVSKATRELIFQAVNVSPLGYQSFYINQKSNQFDGVQNDQPMSNFVQTLGGEVRLSVSIVYNFNCAQYLSSCQNFLNKISKLMNISFCLSFSTSLLTRKGKFASVH